jgi:nucleoside-diphosphate-sugar epimerase
MKILMIGGSGFVASVFRPALQLHRTEKDPELLIASRNAPALLKGERFVHWDATTPSTLDPVFDFIIHLATPASAELNVHDPALMLEANILTMKNILDFACKPTTFVVYFFGSRVRKHFCGAKWDSRGFPYPESRTITLH